MLRVLYLCVALSSVLSAGITSGVTLNFDAASDAGGDSTWASNVGVSTYDWTFSSNLTSSVVSDADTPGITRAYLFPTAKATGASLDGDGGSGGNVSFELWLKADNASGSHVLYETGGSTDGFTISLQHDWVMVSALDNGTDLIEVAAQLDDLTSRHHQVITTIDFDGSGGANLSLYIDGQYAHSANLNPYADWSGTDGTGLGQANGSQSRTGTFTEYEGEISILRYYKGKTLSASEVLDNYNAIAATSGSNILATEDGLTLAEVVVEWDAHVPGADPTNTWSSNGQGSGLVQVIGDWSLTGGTKPALSTVESNRYSNLTQAYYFDGTGNMTMTADWPDTNLNTSLELWFKPSDLTGQEVLWEAGGATDGSSFVLDEETLIFYAKDDGISGNVSYDLSNVYNDDFIKAAVFIDLTNDLLQLYINGKLVDTDNPAGITDWAGEDTNGLGSVGAAHGAALSGFSAYTGYISFFAHYSSRGDDWSESSARERVLSNYESGLKPKGSLFFIE